MIKRKTLISCAGILGLMLGTGLVTHAATTTYYSNGRIEYDVNGNGVVTDDIDVVFDSRDILTLDSKIDTATALLNTGLEDMSDNIDKLVASSDKFEYVLDPNTGEIIGYRTDIGGDTVFSFNEGSYGSSNAAVVSKLTTSPVSTFSLNVSSLIPNYQQLTVDDFLCDISSYTVTTSPGDIAYDSSGTNVNQTNAINKTYNPATGDFTASIASTSAVARTNGCYLYMEYGQSQGRTAYGRVSVSASAKFDVYVVMK